MIITYYKYCTFLLWHNIKHKEKSLRFLIFILDPFKFLLESCGIQRLNHNMTQVLTARGIVKEE